MAAEFDKEKFNKVCDLTYKGQAVFFLNAFWAEYGADKDKIYSIFKKFVELDTKDKQEGKSLDELTSHRLLEAFGDTMTVIQFREEFKKLDQNFDKKMGIIEYLVYKYKVNVKEMLSRPQGTNESLEKAQQELAKVQAEIERIESTKKKLEELSQGEGVKANRAKNELAQLLSQDQTGLNKALIDAKFAIKQAQKAGMVAAQGALFWVEKELEEAAKYKPKSNLKTSFHENEKKQ